MCQFNIVKDTNKYGFYIEQYSELLEKIKNYRIGSWHKKK